MLVDRCRRPHLVRAGRVRRPRRVHGGVPHADATTSRLGSRCGSASSITGHRRADPRRGSRCACRGTICRSQRSPGGSEPLLPARQHRRARQVRRAAPACRRSDFFGIELNTGRTFFYLVCGSSSVLAAHRRDHAPCLDSRASGVHCARCKRRLGRWPRRLGVDTFRVEGDGVRARGACSRASRAGCSRTSSER